MNKEDLILEELQKIQDSLDALAEKQNKIDANVNRLIAWVEKVVERFQQTSKDIFLTNR